MSSATAPAANLAASDHGSQVRITLKTSDETLRLPEEIGAILIGTDVRRYQLSTLVNKLLSTVDPVPLEFIINGQFLRTTLSEHLAQAGLSSEVIHNIEYVRAITPPLPVASYLEEDWIASVSISGSDILTGSFDGSLHIWNSSGNVIASVKSAHSAPICDVSFISTTQAISAGHDRTIRLWNVTRDATQPEAVSLTPTLELYGQGYLIDKVAVHAPSSRILSAAADHTVGIWSSDPAKVPEAPQNMLPLSYKRRKTSHSEARTPVGGPLALMSGHRGRVSGVCFDEKDNTVAYSASWDHSVKTWDLTTQTCIDTRTTSQSLYCIEHLPAMSLLAVGTAQRHLTLVDPRADATLVSAFTLKGHTNSVSSIAKDPNSTHQIVSGSHDGTCRIWDLRSTKSDVQGKSIEAVYVIDRESAKGAGPRIAGDGVKVFDVAWSPEVGIASVGEDMTIQINKGG